MPPTFLIRKVGKRISHRTTTSLWRKLLRFQRTFPEKSFVSGFGVDSPNIQCTQKARHCRAFSFFVIICWNCREGTSALRGFPLKSPLKIRKNFYSNVIYFYVIAFMLRFRKKCIIITLQTQSVCIDEIKKCLQTLKGYSHSRNYALTLQTQSVCIDEIKKCVQTLKGYSHSRNYILTLQNEVLY